MKEAEARERVAKILARAIVGRGFRRAKRGGFIKEAEEVYQLVRIRKSAYAPWCFLDIGVIVKQLVEHPPDGWTLCHCEGDPNTTLGDLRLAFVDALDGSQHLTDEAREAVFVNGLAGFIEPAFDAMSTATAVRECVIRDEEGKQDAYGWRPMRVVREWLGYQCYNGPDP
jgi:hypothetical protein